VRLGFSVRVLGCANLPSYDGRPANEGGRLGLSLAYLRDILYYMQANRLRMYRMHCGLVPPRARQSPKGLERELDEQTAALALIGSLAREWDVRLSFHPYSAVVLSSPNEEQVARSLAVLHAQAGLLDAMSLGPEAVIVLHAGGVYDDLESAGARFAARILALAPSVRARLVLENDDHRFSVAQVKAIHALCGIPLVYDHQHHLVHNPDGLSEAEALRLCLDTWPAQVRPKVHFSTPRPDARRATAGEQVKLPSWTEHADYINPFEFIAFAQAASGVRPFDVMLEAKARDLAVLKLRHDLDRFAPKVLFGPWEA
jgi:UV DNA damage endonuclease